MADDSSESYAHVDTLVKAPAARLSLPQKAHLAKMLLVERGAMAIEHGTRSLLEHLNGTFEILFRWGHNESICLAGLIHSIYSTDLFPDRIVPFSERSIVQAAIGVDAERLAFLFGSLDRSELFAKIRMGSATVPIINRNTGY
jgi:hypothetical protein